MFESDIEINGKHATYLKYLADKSSIFNRYIDVFMSAALVGVLNKKKSDKDLESKDRARIYADVLIREKRHCNEIFKTVILCDESKEWTDEQKLNICFRYRDNADESSIPLVTEEEIKLMGEAKELFISYVLGGIEQIYNDFSEDTDSMSVIKTSFKLVGNYEKYIECGNDQYDDSQLLAEQYD